MFTLNVTCVPAVLIINGAKKQNKQKHRTHVFTYLSTQPNKKKN